MSTREQRGYQVFRVVRTGFLVVPKTTVLPDSHGTSLGIVARLPNQR